MSDHQAIERAREALTKMAEHYEASFYVPDLRGDMNHALHNAGTKSDHARAEALRLILADHAAKTEALKAIKADLHSTTLGWARIFVRIDTACSRALLVGARAVLATEGESHA